MKPLIGITSPVSNGEYNIRTEYAEAVSKAGGLPFMLPHSCEPSLPAAAVDGIIFTGGGDVHPKFYGEEAHPKISDIDESRDIFELALCKESLARHMPILCICRGMQLLNVCLGGTLVQHMENHLYERSQKYLHDAIIQSGTALHSILGELAQVNSRHHQVVSKTAPGIIASAYSPDGFIEAVEILGHPFAIGVQWHPEDLVNDFPAQLGLFEAFVRAAGKV